MEIGLAERLEKLGQSHLLQGWDELSATQRAELEAAISQIDFDLIRRMHAGTVQGGESPADKARRARPPSSRHVVRAQRDGTGDARNTTIATGEAALGRGEVGVILVAGGQGTRLDFPHPKGMFPVGPISGKSLFQILAEQALARSRRAGHALPYLIMTSDATHEETVDYFARQGYFGLDAGDVFFFRQGNLPAVDRATGRILLADKGRISAAPDGHGGLVAALRGAHLLDELRRRGIRYLYYHQVDNPLAKVCDPAFLGAHIEHGSEASTKVVAKLGPEEKVGVFVEIDDHLEVIEYSDLPAELAHQRTESGELAFWGGNTAIHCFNLDFLERLTQPGQELPLHRAVKKVPCMDEQGRALRPEQENAFKFERFIFDALPRAERSLIVETLREQEFAPLKNKTGEFSPDDVKGCLSRAQRAWLAQAGVAVPEQIPVEIGPLLALDADELAERLPAKVDTTRPIYLDHSPAGTPR